MKRIAILGSTGSIGTQTLDVIAQNPTLLKAHVLTAGTNAELLISQALLFQPSYVVIGNPDLYSFVKSSLEPKGIKVLTGSDALCEVVAFPEIDVVLTALVGFAGLLPTIAAIKAKKNIALANKETMVVAGEMISKLATENNVNILPVDSEHSAIYQCLVGEPLDSIEKIYLTASGGPFRGFSVEQLQQVTKNQALKHPNWSMGAKITIDSASMMNKGLEVIEAKWLFQLDDSQIDIIVHPQSILHSLVQFKDNSMKAQMGLPDMKVPIQYALSYPQRFDNQFPRFDFLNYPQLTFEKVDRKVFRNLELAYYALNKKGNSPCILNAANEVAVDLFLKEKIRFVELPELVENALAKISFIENPSLEEILETDKSTRTLTHELY